jgi:endoglucanase
MICRQGIRERSEATRERVRQENVTTPMHQFSSIAALLIWIITCTALHGAVTFTGVNLAAAEFGAGNGSGNLPGTYNAHYTYPTTAEIDYFVTRKAMNAIRLPFRWERLQRSLNGPFDAAELSRLQSIVSYANGRGAFVILDPHNYGKYFSNVIGSPQVPIAAFNDFWTRLANLYRTNNRVIFGLMNEPNGGSTELWRDAANGAIAAIRATGARNLILVPGNGFSIAHNWYDSWYGTANATVMLSITDPANYFAFEVHDYFDDADNPVPVPPDLGVQRLTTFTSWCRQHGRRGFYGEFGVTPSSTALTAMSNVLTFVNANTDVWLGWTYWAAGPWWGGYRFSIEPSNGIDRPQTDVLEKFIPVPLPAVSLTNPPALRFVARLGFIYQVEASSTLTSESWANYGAAVTGANQTVTVAMRTQTLTQEFYRVRVSRVDAATAQFQQFAGALDARRAPPRTRVNFPRHRRDMKSVMTQTQQ